MMGKTIEITEAKSIVDILPRNNKHLPMMGKSIGITEAKSIVVILPRNNKHLIDVKKPFSTGLKLETTPFSGFSNPYTYLTTILGGKEFPSGDVRYREFNANLGENYRSAGYFSRLDQWSILGDGGGIHEPNLYVYGETQQAYFGNMVDAKAAANLEDSMLSSRIRGSVRGCVMLDYEGGLKYYGHVYGHTSGVTCLTLSTNVYGTALPSKSTYGGYPNNLKRFEWIVNSFVENGGTEWNFLQEQNLAGDYYSHPYIFAYARPHAGRTHYTHPPYLHRLRSQGED